jgi:hypothetical protein
MPDGSSSTGNEVSALPGIHKSVTPVPPSSGAPGAGFPRNAHMVPAGGGSNQGSLPPTGKSKPTGNNSSSTAAGGGGGGLMLPSIGGKGGAPAFAPGETMLEEDFLRFSNANAQLAPEDRGGSGEDAPKKKKKSNKSNGGSNAAAPATINGGHGGASDSGEAGEERVGPLSDWGFADTAAVTGAGIGQDSYDDDFESENSNANQLPPSNGMPPIKGQKKVKKAKVLWNYVIVCVRIAITLLFFFSVGIKHFIRGQLIVSQRQRSG